MNTRKIAARNVEASNAAARGQHEPVVFQCLAAIEPDTVVVGLQFLRADAEPQLHAALLVEAHRAEQEALPIQLASKVFLGQGRALVRWQVFLPYQRDAAVEFLLPQGLNSLGGGLPPSHDDDVPARHGLSNARDCMRIGILARTSDRAQPPRAAAVNPYSLDETR